MAESRVNITNILVGLLCAILALGVYYLGSNRSQEMSAISEEREQHQAKVRGLKTQLEESESENQELRLRISRLDEELALTEESRLQFEDARQELESEQQRLAEENQQLQKELSSVEAAKSVLEQRLMTQGDNTYVSTLLQQNAALQVELAKARSDLRDPALRQREIEILRAEEMRLTRELQDAVSIGDHLAKELTAEKQLRDTLASHLARLQAQHGNLERRLEALDVERDTLEVELRTVRAQLETATQQKVALINEKNALIQQVAQMNQVLERKLAELQVAKTTLRDQVSAGIPGLDASSQQTATPGFVELPPIVVKQNVSDPTVPPPAPLPVEDLLARPSDLGRELDAPPEELAEATITREKAEEVLRKLTRPGKVLSVNQQHGFVVVNLGVNQGLRAGDQLEVIRNGRSVGVMGVLEARANVSAADLSDLEEAPEPEDRVVLVSPN
ncbi:MAG: hypothetical protein JW937_07625 [Candidatus Omnitrophica bacterium]|nr:hypothetical protein [Candidatus Omnitrophota bacterium]